MSTYESTLVIGIAGGTASGKTSLARGLVRALGADRALLLLHDRYYHSLPRELRHDPVQYNFDHPDALDTPRLVEDLHRLREGRSALLPVYDFATHSRAPRSSWERVEPHPIVVLEGILVLADPGLRAAMDHRVFVEAPDDIRLVRRIRRDVMERGREVGEILRQYETTVRPMHEAHVAPSRVHAERVLDGTSDLAAMVASLVRWTEATPPSAP